VEALPRGIAGEVAAAGGRVTLARFMELALTHATEGYYSAAPAFLGARGDFSTAPTLSRDFCESVARLVEELILGMLSAQKGRPVALIELGGGHGELLRSVLTRLRSEQPGLRELVTCTVVEVGRRVRARQRRALARPLREGWRVEWVPTVAAALARADGAAVVMGNEFLDALPVHVVDVQGDTVGEAWVEAMPGKEESGVVGLREKRGPLTPEAETELEAVLGTMETAALGPLTLDGAIEVRPAVGGLLDELAASGLSCCLLTIDYGRWYGMGRPDLAGQSVTPYRRTLRGYFRHQRVDDLFVRVGRQDLTADVDFRALEWHGRRAGFETVLYATAAELLRGDSGEERLSRLKVRAASSLEADRRAAVLQELLDPESVGGAYRVMLQVRE